jgi:hypothetical protein
MTNLPPKKSTVYRNSGVWLKLKQLGYDVIPLAQGKAFPFKGWPKTPNDTAEIMKWSGRSAAIRMSGSDALVVDLDTQVPEALAAIIAMMTQRWPEFMAGCLRRHSGGVKLALIGRCLDPPPGPMATARYYPSGHMDEKAFENRVEIFHKHVGTRYVAVHGMHSPGREYGYHGTSILDVPLSELPVFPGKDIGALADACEKIMAGLGYDSDLAGALRGMSEVTVYDLTPELMFRLKEGDRVTIAELADMTRQHGKHEGYASIWDAGTDCPDRIKANWSAEGLSLWDSHTQIRHRMIGAERPKEAPDLTTFAGLIGGMAGEPDGEPAADLPRTCGEPAGPDREPDREPAAMRAPPMPAFGAPLASKVQWLLETRAYHETNDSVVELYRADDECQYRWVAFQHAYASMYEMHVGPRGGHHMTYATTCWQTDPRRINLAGVRMHPARSFPLYRENGAIYKNTYQAVQHTGDGDINPWLEFMSHLLPDPIERAYFLNWLAHKYQHPEIPGVGLVMVAATLDGRPVYGCGRGMLFDILAYLFGRHYVKPVDFDIFIGRSSQGIYTDWAAYALLVTVNEARDAEAGRWSERRAVYERIKEVVDPRVMTRTFIAKGRQAFQATSFASYLIASNNNDAFQMPADDRRLAVLRNGLRLPAEQAVALRAWMEQPGNIAALARWLGARHLGSFDPYLPLHTAAKTVMQDIARSDLDEWFEGLRGKLDCRSMFTGDQMRQAIELEAGREEVAQWRHAIQRLIRARCMQVPSTVANLRTPRDATGRRHKILCWRDYSGPPVGNTPAAVAAVERSGRVLFEDSDEPAAPAARAGLHTVGSEEDTEAEGGAD